MSLQTELLGWDHQDREGDGETHREEECEYRANSCAKRPSSANQLALRASAIRRDNILASANMLAPTSPPRIASRMQNALFHIHPRISIPVHQMQLSKLREAEATRAWLTRPS